MNSISKIAGLSVLLLTGIFAVHNSTGLSAVIITQDCACGTAGCGGGCAIERRAGCRKCGARRGCQKCPKCQVECCQLEIKTGESKETCFQTEQKIVCIPRVRMPWQKCCPPTKSKTRTVKVLKTHSFKCPSCEYKWSLIEPEIPESDGDKSPGLEGQPVTQLPEYNVPYEPVPVSFPSSISHRNSHPIPTSNYDPSVPSGSR